MPCFFTTVLELLSVPHIRIRAVKQQKKKGKEGQQVDLSTCNMFSLIYVKLFDQIALHLNETIEPGYSI